MMNAFGLNTERGVYHVLERSRKSQTSTAGDFMLTTYPKSFATNHSRSFSDARMPILIKSAHQTPNSIRTMPCLPIGLSDIAKIRLENLEVGAVWAYLKSVNHRLKLQISEISPKY